VVSRTPDRRLETGVGQAPRAGSRRQEAGQGARARKKQRRLGGVVSASQSSSNEGEITALNRASTEKFAKVGARPGCFRNGPNEIPLLAGVLGPRGSVCFVGCRFCGPLFSLFCA